MVGWALKNQLSIDVATVLVIPADQQINCTIDHHDLCVCSVVHVLALIRVCVYACACACACVFVYVCVGVRVLVYDCVSVRARMCVCVYIYMCVCACVCMSARARNSLSIYVLYKNQSVSRWELHIPHMAAPYFGLNQPRSVRRPQ